MTPLQQIFKDYLKHEIKKFGLRKWTPSNGSIFSPAYGRILNFLKKISQKIIHFFDKKNVKKKFFFVKNFFVFYYSNFDQNSNFMNFDENFRSKKSSKSLKFNDFYIKIIDFDENFKKKVACGGHPHRESP